MGKKRNITDMDQQVAQWIGVLETGDVSPDEFQSFLYWRDQKAEHKEAFEKAYAVWHRVRSFEVPVPKSLTQHDTQWYKNDWHKLRYWLGKLQMPVAWVTAIAVCALLIVVVGLGQYSQTLPQKELLVERQHSQIYIANRAQTLRVELDDGSVMHLKALSTAEVRYSHDVRQINLKTGEAYFDVVKDISRPFRVYARQGVIEAVGTRFGVALNGVSDLRVKLVEGKIKISDQQGLGKFDRVMSHPGHSLVVVQSKSTGNKNVWKITDEYTRDPESLVAWINGRLIFRGTPLSTAVQEINRYSNHTLVLGDEDLKYIPVYASIETGDWRAALEAIEFSLGVISESFSPSVTYLYSAESQATMNHSKESRVP